MASSFPFIPRALVKGKQKDSQHTPQASMSTSPSLGLTTATPGNKSKYSNADYINLFNLALSNYALWADPELQCTIDWSSGNEQSGDGCFPLSHLIQHSKVLSSLNIENLQIPIAKALRSDATSAVEVQLLISEPLSSTWSGKGDTTRDIGAYKVCRRDTSAHSQNYSRQHWEDRTVYVESIPVQYRTIPVIIHLISSLLSERSSPESCSTHVQGIILPPHHQDKPDNPLTCKGFALIVFQDILDVNFLLKRWPWDRQHSAGTDLQNCEAPPEVTEATKFGFCALSKSCWDKLNDKYLSYRERLVAEINAFQDAAKRPLLLLPVPKPNAEAIDTNHPIPAPAELPKLNNTSPYPFDSLVFIRNVHPETNETTLQKFFGHAFKSSLASNKVDSDGIDYVDYNKGMDSCHLRLAMPQHAHILTDHFTSTPTIHSISLDNIGKSPDGMSPPVLVELVMGKREQLYWEKVPEKVQRLAVQNALASVKGASYLDVGNGVGDEVECDGEADTWKWKRRRH